MSTIYNTSIVRDNLILHYDAANVKSYPGSGAIINNLAPNKTYGARIAGSNITFSSSEKAFSNNTAGGTTNVTDGIYIEGLNYVNGSGDAVSNMTVECWCKSKSGSSGSTGDQRIIVSFDRSAVFRFAIGADGASISAGAAGKPSLMWVNGSNDNIIDNYADTYSGDLRDNKFHQVAVTFTTSSVKYYIDGICVDTHTGSWSALSNHSGENETPRFGWIGNGSEAETAGGTIGPASLFYGSIANFKYYYKTLSDVEMKQNFDALKGRFGI